VVALAACSSAAATHSSGDCNRPLCLQAQQREQQQQQREQQCSVKEQSVESMAMEAKGITSSAVDEVRSKSREIIVLLTHTCRHMTAHHITCTHSQHTLSTQPGAAFPSVRRDFRPSIGQVPSTCRFVSPILLCCNMEVTSIYIYIHALQQASCAHTPLPITTMRQE
jgi:hypothetical protein